MIGAPRQKKKAYDPIDCGCYHCCSMFSATMIVEWADDGIAALCPICGVDSVVAGQTDLGILMAANDRWFGGSAFRISSRP